ncbi:Pex12 amino terminal region-domain-containing protein [Cladochytrium replicatum]|nr:Pex12 amino terminal region-domain-containing protein [Cladochytrium replicatum]
MEFLGSTTGAPIGNTQLDDPLLRPSLFELIAQDKMRELLKPALSYALHVYAQASPNRTTLALVRWQDEAFAALMGIVELHHLTSFSASFAEMFYGFKRVPVSKKTNWKKRTALKLSALQIIASTLVAVALPYVRGKLSELYEEVRIEATAGGAASSLLGDDDEESYEEQDDPLGGQDTLEDSLEMRAQKRFRRTFLKLYPYVNGLYHATTLGYQIGYLYSLTDNHSPLLHLIGIRVVRMTMKDMREQAANTERMRATRGEILSALLGQPNNLIRFIRLLSQLSLIGASRALDALRTALPLSVFFFRFLEWWYASGFHKRAGGAAGITPPPPQPILPHPDGTPVPEDPTLCPLCLKKRTNATMLPTGYVFCYPCVFRYVSDHGRCPVTFASVEIEKLRRIYAVSA